MKQCNSEQTKTKKNRFSVNTKAFSSIIKQKDFQRHNTNSNKMKSDDKLINFSEMIPKLLETIKSKNSSRLNLIIDNNSFEHNSNSSELYDEDEPIKNEINKINIGNMNNKPTVKSPKKLNIQSIGKSPFLKLDNNEYKNLEIPGTFRQKKKIDKSPSINYRKYSKENKDSLILKLHKYFFQDGELENIDTLIKYDIYKIKINDDNNESNFGRETTNERNSDNDFDYYNIKEKVVNIMDKFSSAFDNENKSQLILAMKELNDFSKNYKFDYVTQLTFDWLTQMKEKKYENCELKYIGYYNQIRDIMDKMLNELKRKADMILITRKKNNKENKNENKNNNNNDNSIKKDILNNDSTIKIPNIIINRNLQKKNSINKDDLLRTKEIIPIKVDIEIQSSLKIDEVEDILKNLDEGDLGNLGNNKGPMNNNKKILNLHSNNRSDNELEAFSYPFKDDSLCYIF